MSKKKANIIIAVILAVTAAITLFYYPSVPDIIPIHWGPDGQVDGTGPKYMLFVFWAIAAGVNLLMLFAEKIDPKGENYKKFPKAFNVFRIFITGLQCGLVLLTIAFSFNPQVLDMNSIIYPVMGLMTILLGNYMPKVKHNYTFGIKTMWTIASENVWNKTHRMAGPLWVACGLVIAAMTFVKNTTAAAVAMSVVLVVIVAVPTVYSYFEFRKENKNNTEE